jgi:acyl-CoA oxidase
MRADSFLGIVRRGAVGLVDAWAFSDMNLNSALGRYDGRVYEALYSMAQREPLNAKAVPDGYEQLLQPLIKSNL